MHLKADNAQVEWDSQKKRWEVHIEIGAEVIKRPLPDHTLESGDDAVRQQAVATANDEGYELDPQTVAIAR
ncbi:MAG: hypothetical protein WBY44_35425 [Bryobacteraceae bacterium]|jgi:hypothetical protein